MSSTMTHARFCIGQFHRLAQNVFLFVCLFTKSKNKQSNHAKFGDAGSELCEGVVDIQTNIQTHIYMHTNIQTYINVLAPL